MSRPERSNQMTYFAFFPHTQLVRGKKGASIHDLFNQKLYWLNEAKTAKAITSLAHGESISAAAASSGLTEKTLQRSINLLQSLRLGTPTPHRTISEGYRPVLSAAQAKDKAIFLSGGTVTCEITSRCLYDCPWCSPKNPLTTKACSCGVWSNLAGAFPAEKRIFALERLQEQGYTHVVIRGGEPMLEENQLFAILEKAAQLEIKSEVHTTGFLINNVSAQLFHRHNTHLVLMAAADNENDFDAATQRKGSWKKFHKCIQMLQSNNVSFTLKVPVSIEQPETPQTLAEWAIELGATDIDYIIYAPPNNGYTAADLRHVTASSAPSDMAVSMQQFFKNAECHSCFNNTCFISADGNLSACIGHRKPIANLRKTAMSKVLHQDLLNLSRTATSRHAMPDCKGCEFRYGCWACLVRTEQLQGSKEQKHWNCLYDPGQAQWAE